MLMEETPFAVMYSSELTARMYKGKRNLAIHIYRSAIPRSSTSLGPLLN